MATATPGGSPLFPGGQKREQFGRDWGNYATVAGMPNGSGNVLTADQFRLEAGDRCYLTLSGSESEYLCVSAGAATLGNAVWIPNTGLGPWSSVLYVDNVRGSDTTGQRGNANRPFATIQAAFNAMLTDDFVTLAPQTHQITAVLTVPATAVRFGCSGALPILASGSFTGSVGSTIRQMTAGTSCLDLGANLGLNRCILANICWIPGTATTPAIVADGSAYAVLAYLTGGLVISSCENLSITEKYAFTISIFEGTGSSQSPLSFTGTFNTTLTRVNAGNANLLCSYDVADPHVIAGLGAGNVTLKQGTIVGGLVTNSRVVLTGQIGLFVDQTSTTGGVTASGLTVSGAVGPTVNHCGFIGKTAGGIGIDFSTAGSEIPDTATTLSFDFRGARLYCETINTPPTSSVVGIVAARFSIAGAAANAQSVAMDSSIALPGTSIVAHANVNVTARGAAWPNATLSTPDASGTILPPSPLKIAPVAVAAAPQPITYPCRIPAGSTAVQVMYNTDNAGSVPTNVVTLPTQTGCSLGLVAAGGGNVYPTVMFPG